MERFINFRAFLFVFIGAILGSVFSFQVFSENLICYIITFVLTLLALIYIILTSFLSKNNKIKFINKFLICILVGFTIFSSLSSINYLTFNKNLESLENVNVIGRVCTVNENAEYNYLILEDCKVIDFKEETTYGLSGKISLVVYSEDVFSNLSIGDKVNYTGNLNSNKLIENNQFNSYYYKNNIKYSSFVNDDVFSFTDGNLKLDENFREKVKNILFSNMSYDNASICYASIFGDKTLIEDKIYESFSLSGTAHILCVSGLHVGFLVALLYFIFKLLKLKPKVILIILSIVLFIYCYLCGFSTSVVRASIMSIILCFASTFGTRYDSLSALSLSGIIILLFKPFYIFDLGFQLSFAACFGIILLTPSFVSFFEKINFSNKFSETLSITLAAQVGTFPIILHNFEKMSMLSICANIIIVPLFSVLFTILIVFVFINAIFPMGFLFYLVEIILNFIIFLTKGFGSVSSMIFQTNTFSLFYSLLFYILVLCLSKFINLKNKSRLIFISVLVITFCFSFLLQYYPNNFNSNLLLSTNVENCNIITNSYNQKIMINLDERTNDDYAVVNKDLLNYKILKLDALILSNYSENSQTFVVNICNKYNVDTLYLPSSLTYNEEKYLFENLNSTFIFKAKDNFYGINNINFKILTEINGVYLNVMENNHSFTMLIGNNLDKTTASYLIRENLTGNFIKFNYLNKNYINSVEKFDIIFCNNANIRQTNIYSIKNLSKLIDLNNFKEKIYEV